MNFPCKTHTYNGGKDIKKSIMHNTEAAFIPRISSVISFSVKSNYNNQAQLIFGRQCVAKISFN